MGELGAHHGTGPSRPTSTPRRRSVRSRVWLLRAPAEAGPEAADLLDRPLVAAPHHDVPVNALLPSVGHGHWDELDRPARTPVAARPRQAGPRSHPRAPRTPLHRRRTRRRARVGVRRLHAAFRRYVGLSPMAHLREVRLTRVHEEPRPAPPRRVGCERGAHRYGFRHLGGSPSSTGPAPSAGAATTDPGGLRPGTHPAGSDSSAGPVALPPHCATGPPRARTPRTAPCHAA